MGGLDVRLQPVDIFQGCRKEKIIKIAQLLRTWFSISFFFRFQPNSCVRNAPRCALIHLLVVPTVVTCAPHHPRTCITNGSNIGRWSSVLSEISSSPDPWFWGCFACSTNVNFYRTDLRSGREMVLGERSNAYTTLTWLSEEMPHDFYFFPKFSLTSPPHFLFFFQIYHH